jgi:hypothetical protein
MNLELLFGKATVASMKENGKTTKRTEGVTNIGQVCYLALSNY